MRCLALAAASACAVVSLGIVTSPAKAGDYYGGGYYGGGYGYYPRHDNVWYSSNCCYRKVVRHERSVHYVPADEGRRYGYYDRPYWSSSYSESPRYGYPAYSHYSGYSDGYGSYAESCTARRVRVDDGRGGWVWGRASSCY